MKSVIVTGPDTREIRDVKRPEMTAGDVVAQVKACGVCGSDTMYMHSGGLPPLEGRMPLGHEVAGEVIEVGADVDGVTIGDHVVVNPMTAPDGIIGNGGEQGGLSEYLLLRNAEQGISFRVIPDEIPWEVAALNEPMAVAFHAVNRSEAGPGTQAVVFGAGPVGLGVAIGLQAKGVDHVTVVDVIPQRLDKALRIGADAVINSATEDVIARLKEVHGEIEGFNGMPARPASDVYIDAAGVPIVFDTVLRAIRQRGVFVVVAVHKSPVQIDLQEALMTELDLRLSMGYPTEIFEVTDSLIQDWDKYQLIIGDVVPFREVSKGLEMALTPGASDKVVITFD